MNLGRFKQLVLLNNLLQSSVLTERRIKEEKTKKHSNTIQSQ